MNIEHIKGQVQLLKDQVARWKFELAEAEQKHGWFFEQHAASLRNRIQHAEQQIGDHIRHINLFEPIVSTTKDQPSQSSGSAGTKIAKTK